MSTSHYVQQRFAGKVAIITGAGTGMGLDAAIALAAQGAKVVLSARTQSTLDAAVKTITEQGGEALAVAADVGIDAENCKIVNAALDKFGRVDLAFLNAGVGGGADFKDIEEELVNKLLNTNIKSVIYGFKHILPAIQASGGNGSIVVNTSTAAYKAMVMPELPGFAVYSATKAAAEMLVQYGAIEAAEHGTRVNAIAPGIVKTDIMGGPDAMTQEQWDALGASMGLYPARAGTVAEVTKLVTFLLSDDASFINGSSHMINAGAHIKH